MKDKPQKIKCFKKISNIIAVLFFIINPKDPILFSTDVDNVSFDVSPTLRTYVI